MRLIALGHLTGKTQTIQKGAIFNLPDEKAKGLIEAGYVQPFCYWQDRAIEDCQLPCFKITPGKVTHECKHFTKYWQHVQTRGVNVR